VRNRVKRRLREALRALLPRVRPGWDLSFNARQPAATAGLADLRQAAEDTMRRAGALGD
jgi:ribonuclease P protein component